MRSEQRARRLDTTLGHILYLGLVLVALGGGAGLAVTHVHRFHLALAARRLAAKNNAWLAEQCRTPEFYANMREHSALCDEVALAEADALWLHALRDVFDGSRPCGEAGCAEALAAGLGWVFGRGVWALCAAGAGALALSWSVLAVQRALARGGAARRGAGYLDAGRGATRCYAELGDVDAGPRFYAALGDADGGGGGGLGGLGGGAARRRHPLALGA